MGKGRASRGVFAGASGSMVDAGHELADVKSWRWREVQWEHGSSGAGAVGWGYGLVANRRRAGLAGMLGIRARVEGLRWAHAPG